MKINKLQINGYGNLKNKEIKLNNELNIIYGNNESGKSTLLSFISNSLYGISKNKNGKDISDYDKYMPWTGDEFSGKIDYELDNGEKIEVFRDFKKKNPSIFNENKEEISKQFNIDKTKGNEFFYEQTKVDEELFLSTIVVNQQEVKLGKQEQNILIQKLANLVGTGDDNTSYKKAIDRINRRQLDEIGTSRSREKPINILEKNITILENQKEELKQYEDSKYEIEKNKNEIENEIDGLVNKNNYLKEIKLLNENQKIEEEKIRIKEDIKNENLEKIELLKDKIVEMEDEKKEQKNKVKEKKNSKLNTIKILTFIILIIMNVIQFIVVKNKLINYMFLLTIPILLIVLITFKSKHKNINKKEKYKTHENIERIDSEINNINNEIDLLERNNAGLTKEIENLKNNFILKIKLEEEKIRNKYINILENDTIERINNLNDLESINHEIINIENELNNKKVQLHTLEIDVKNVEPKLDSLAKLEEDLFENKEKMLALKKLEASMEIAKEVLEKSYEKMKNTVTPKFTQNLSLNISKITNGKYNTIKFSDEQGLIVELQNGNNISADKLSVGTIDQLYLSLRLSMVEELSDEKMPIILDETFAYCDAERLTNILKYISEKFNEHQIIIFTCTNREKDILEKNDIKYNLIEM